MKKEENVNALKHLYNQQLLVRISKSFHGLHPNFDHKHFLSLMTKLSSLEMKPRVLCLRDELKKQLPSEYPIALQLLLKSMKKGNLTGFDLWPYTEYVQTYGTEHLEQSLHALAKFTQKFTAEWAIRPFIKLYPKQTLSFLLECTKNKNVHLRRLASEGTRPRLPWGERLHLFIKDPSPTLPILEALKFDSELYVRKSIANHLNDITKDHPEFVIKLLSRWKKQAGSKHLDKINWIIYRSLRTLIKNGHPGALSLIGVSQKVKVKLQDLKIHQSSIKIGEKIDFEFYMTSTSTKPQKIVVDYIIHFVKSNKSTTPKVFKLKTLEILAKQKIQIIKSHSLKKITTRSYYPGTHFLSIQINGIVIVKKPWVLRS